MHYVHLVVAFGLFIFLFPREFWLLCCCWLLYNQVIQFVKEVSSSGGELK